MDQFVERLGSNVGPIRPHHRPTLRVDARSKGVGPCHDSILRQWGDRHGDRATHINDDIVMAQCGPFDINPTPRPRRTRSRFGSSLHEQCGQEARGKRTRLRLSSSECLHAT
jgi:hypothetical protein